MLQICIPGGESWDEKNEVFIYGQDTIINLEHSLISISKWESKWHKPFTLQKLTDYSDIVDYIKCMTVTPNVNDEVYSRLTKKNIDDVLNYMGDSMTATTITEAGPKGHRNKEIVTSELIYYWMVALQIPFECQKWHINRLMTLIRICSIKNQPEKSMSKRNIMQQNAAINAARRKKLHSRG